MKDDNNIYDTVAFLDYMRRKFLEDNPDEYSLLRGFIHNNKFFTIRYKIYKDDILEFVNTKNYKEDFLIWLGENEKYFKF